MRWKFVCRKVTEESSWGQYLWESEDSITGQKEKVNLEAAVKKSLTNPLGSCIAAV